MKLSIIIPVYNVEQYLPKCLDSVFEQDNCSTDDYEVIIVIDGSPDNSLSIAKSYEAKFKNCIVINQENQGLSGARNTGLQHAKGDYVWFVDSDDWIAPESVTMLKSKIDETKPDMIGFNFIRYHQDGRPDVIEYPFVKNIGSNIYKRCYNGLSLCRKIHIGAVPRYLISRKFLTEHKLTFKRDIYFEDTEFLPRAIFFAKRICFIDANLYYYYIRTSGSIMSTFKGKYIDSIYRIMGSLDDFRKKNARTWKEQAFLYEYTLYQVCRLNEICRKHKMEAKQFDYNKSKVRLMGTECFVKSILPYFSLGKCWSYFKLMVCP